jgi:lactate dehydrogenase-like 2-hydroxyacid dehydrogenase
MNASAGKTNDRQTKIWITRRLSDATLERAARDYDAIINMDDGLSTDDDIVAMSAKVDAIMPCHSEHFTAEVAERLDPRLKIIANHSVGVDHCDLPALKARGIAVTNTPDVLSDATAEIAMLLMLGAARHAVEGDHLVRSGQWDFWSPSFMVGKQVTGRASGHHRHGSRRPGLCPQGARLRHGHPLLQPDPPCPASRRRAWRDLSRHHRKPACRVRLPVAALPGDARNNRPDECGAFALLPKGAVLINTARGALVDESALLAPWRKWPLAAAGLDCFVTEPGGNPAFAPHQEHLHAAPYRQRHNTNPRRHGFQGARQSRRLFPRRNDP